MNFENYNKIYQEILDDDKNELSANYLLNKYEIIHDEELINILNQIKKNEYVSSENKIINKLLKELDDNEDLLDVNEIINIKNKVINPKVMNNFLKNENIDSNIHIEKDIERKQKIKSNIKIIIENIKQKFLVNNIKEKSIENLMKYKFYSLPIILLLGIFFMLSNLYSENKSLLIEKDKLEKTIQKNELIEEKDSSMVIDKVDDTTEEKSIPQVNNQESKLVKDNEIIEEKLNILEDNQTQVPNKINNEILLDSLEEIAKYIKEFKYVDGKLEYKNEIYSENDILFGFKIYKLSAVYVKFQDEKNKVRKTFIINK